MVNDSTELKKLLDNIKKVPASIIKESIKEVQEEDDMIDSEELCKYCWYTR